MCYNIYMGGYIELRRTQQAIMLGTIRAKFEEIAERETFINFAEKLTNKYFKYSIKKELEILEIVKKLFVDWLILAPVISRFKWLYKPGMHWGHVLTWIRRNVSYVVRNFYFITYQMNLDENEDKITKIAVNNAIKYAGINPKNKKFLEEEFYFISAIAKTTGLKSKLAKKILYPYLFLNIDFLLDKQIGFNKTIREKKILKGKNKNAYSYFRVLNRAIICSNKQIEEEIKIGNTLLKGKLKDLRKEKVKISDFVIFYEEFKDKKGALQVKLDKDRYTELKAEIKAIIENRGITPQYKLFNINRVVGDFIEKYKFAYSDSLKFFELNRWIRRIVRRKIAPTLGPSCLKHLYLPGAQDLTNELFLQRTNPFWELKISEERYLQWWNPYI